MTGESLISSNFLQLQLVADLDKLHVQVLLAAPNTPLCQSLHRYGFFKRYSAERLFPTVLTAVDYVKQGKKCVSGVVWLQ